MRVTTEIVRSGQPRPYADSVTEGRLIFEDQHWRTKEWRPRAVSEEMARDVAAAMPCGYMSRTAEERGHGLESYLASFEGTGSAGTRNGEESYSTIWTFVVIHPFCD